MDPHEKTRLAALDAARASKKADEAAKSKARKQAARDRYAADKVGAPAAECGVAADDAVAVSAGSGGRDDAQPAARALLSPTLAAVRARKRQQREEAALSLASISTSSGERGGASAGDGLHFDGVRAAARADSVSPATAACLVALAGEDVRGYARYARLTTALLPLYPRRPTHFGELPDGKFSIECQQPLTPARSTHSRLKGLLLWRLFR